MFTELKDLNLLKEYIKNQEASSIFRVEFALSKLLHLHRPYLVTVQEYLSQAAAPCLLDIRKWSIDHLKDLAFGLNLKSINSNSLRLL